MRQIEFSAGFLYALRVSTPVFFGYIAIGMPFGFMLVNAGYPWWLAPIMSLVMYAGAGQYAAVGLFAAKMPLSISLITMLAVNIRHIVYGLSLIEKFKPLGKSKLYVIFALTDETYALLSTVYIPANISTEKFYVTVAALHHSYWIAGGLLGAIAGSLIPFDFVGIDFALTALFTVLLIEQLKKADSKLPCVIGFASAFCALIIFGPDKMLVAALAMGIAILSTIIRKKSCQ